jgi:hypothetical protein
MRFKKRIKLMKYYDEMISPEIAFTDEHQLN